MDDNRHLVLVASEPLEQGIRMNDVVQLGRGEMAPFLARPEKVADNDPQSCLRQIEHDVRPDKPGASRHDDQVAAGILNCWHDPLSRSRNIGW